MGAYILRRLLLIIPTLFGIMALNFVVIQFAPGGPVEQILAEVDTANQTGGATGRFTGGSGDGGGGGGGGAGSTGEYRGAQGLDAEYLAALEVQFGFARIVCAEGYTGEPDVEVPECEKQAIPLAERFTIMIGNYLVFDFGESFYRSVSVIDLVLEKMPVSITLGLWTTLIAYLVSIPLGIVKAVRDGSRFDGVTSAVIVAAYAIPGFLFAVMLLVLFAGGSFYQLFPLRGLHSDNWEQMSWGAYILDYLWHIVLPVTSMAIAGFATLTLLTKNSFLDEIRKQYVMTARAKGLGERRVLYGHVFRNAMLIVIAGFPGAFISIFFTGSLIIETVFSLDGLGLLGFESVVNRDYPVVLGTLYLFGLIGLVVKLISDLTYVWIDPRIDFEAREG
ncbi:MAG: microcin C ABC transporter permease YejB [Pseudomonadota bacterium]